MPFPRSVLLAAVAAALLAPAVAGGAYDPPEGVGHTAQGGVVFQIHYGDNVYSYDFHFVTKCGTVRIPGKLYWGESESRFSYRSSDGRVAMYTYNFTGPDGGGYGWVSDRRANG